MFAKLVDKKDAAGEGGAAAGEGGGPSKGGLMSKLTKFKVGEGVF